MPIQDLDFANPQPIVNDHFVTIESGAFGIIHPPRENLDGSFTECHAITVLTFLGFEPQYLLPGKYSILCVASKRGVRLRFERVL